MPSDPTPPLTPEELQEMKGRCFDLTTGQVLLGFGMEDETEGKFSIYDPWPPAKRKITKEDCQAILTAITSMPRLIAEIERQQMALRIIREAGQNDDDTASWMQRWAAWGMEPNKWPKPTATPSVPSA
jgi:hypothetical protein